MSKQRFSSETLEADGSPTADLTPALDDDDVRTALPESLRGSADFLERHTLYGSAWDAGDHARVVEVEIYCGDEFLDTVAADTYRHDLALAGVGDGRHGFEYRLPADVDTRSVRVSFAHTDIALPEGPFFRPDDNLSPPSDQTLSELKGGLDDLENSVENIAATLRGLEARINSIGEQAKTGATREDLGKLHGSLMPPVAETRAKMDEICQSGNRIEGFLNIELGKRITKELDMEGLREQFRRIDSRLRAASFGRLFIVLLVLGLAAMFLLFQPVDWDESLQSAIGWFLRLFR